MERCFVHGISCIYCGTTGNESSYTGTVSSCCCTMQRCELFRCGWLNIRSY
jgi:hypothetical protein